MTNHFTEPMRFSEGGGVPSSGTGTVTRYFYPLARGDRYRYAERHVKHHQLAACTRGEVSQIPAGGDPELSQRSRHSGDDHRTPSARLERRTNHDSCLRTWPRSARVPLR